MRVLDFLGNPHHHHQHDSQYFIKVIFSYIWLHFVYSRSSLDWKILWFQIFKFFYNQLASDCMSHNIQQWEGIENRILKDHASDVVVIVVVWLIMKLSWGDVKWLPFKMKNWMISFYGDAWEPEILSTKQHYAYYVVKHGQFPCEMRRISCVSPPPAALIYDFCFTCCRRHRRYVVLLICNGA